MIFIDSFTQGCQLLEFSLTFQTIFYTADFRRIFLYMLETTTFPHPITKHPASTLEFQYLYSILQIDFCEPGQKQEKRPFPRWHLLCLGRPMTCGNAYVKHFVKFPDFLRRNVGNPGIALLATI